jgi:hypothetical protein
MLKKNKAQVKQEISEIILELVDDPRFCIEDIAEAIYVKVFEAYQLDLLAHFAIPADQGDRHALR